MMERAISQNASDENNQVFEAGRGGPIAKAQGRES